jgi:hypothetical protein
MTDGPTYGFEEAEASVADRLGYSYDTGLTSDAGNAVDYDVSNDEYLDRSTGEGVDFYDTTS